MGQVQSGASSDLWTIDPASNAGRVSLYDAAGNALISSPSNGSFIANILLRQSATTAANSCVWALFNAHATIKARIRSIRQVILFDGTAAAATTRAYYWQRISTAAPTGGTAILPTEKRTAGGAAVVDVRFLDTGLTGATLVGTGGQDSFARVALPISVTSFVYTLPQPYYVANERLISPIELGQNEGIGLFLNEQTTVGMGTSGLVEWDETT